MIEINWNPLPHLGLFLINWYRLIYAPATWWAPIWSYAGC